MPVSLRGSPKSTHAIKAFDEVSNNVDNESVESVFDVDIDSYHSHFLSSESSEIEASRRPSVQLLLAHDDDSFEFVSEGTGTIISASINFTNSIVGAGIIGLPFALRRTGALSGLLLLAFVAFMTDYGCRLLIISGVKAKKKSFESLCAHVFGSKGYYAVLGLMMSLAFGAMIAYLIVIGDTLPQVAKFLRPGSVFENRSFAIFVFATFLILPLSMLRDMATLATTSFVSLIAVFFIVFSVVACASSSAEQQNIPSLADDLAFMKPTFFGGMGAMSFAFVCHHNSFIVFNSMARPSIRNWRTVAHLSVGVSWLLSLIMSSWGYFNFASKTQADILNNFAHDDEPINVARILLAFTMVLTTLLCYDVSIAYSGVALIHERSNSNHQSTRVCMQYPMEIFVARHCIVEAVCKGSREVRYHVVVTFGLWFVSLIISLFLKDLGVVLELTGAFSASSLGYILPALCYLHVEGAQRVCRMFSAAWSRNASGQFIVASCTDRIRISFRCIAPILMLAFGIVSMVAGTASAFIGDQ